MIANLNGCFECSKNEQNDMQYKNNEITKTEKKNEQTERIKMKV